MSKLKKDCTPEEWTRYLASQRKHNAAITADPARRQAYRDRAKARYAKRRDERPEEHAAHLKRASVANARPERRAADRARNQTPERKAQSLAKHRHRLYELTPERADALLRLQGHACAVCRRPFEWSRIPHVDHCHLSGLVRGFLCARCNSTEGFLVSVGLTPAQFAERLTAYLTNPPADQVKA